MSGITRISKFRTADGKEHDTELEAKQHQNRVDIGKVIMDYYKSNFDTNRADSLLKSMLNDPIPMRDALTALIRKNQIKVEAEEIEHRKAA